VELWYRFQNPHYQRHNARRLEHLATLGLVAGGERVLETGAGIGDLSTFFIDRGCRVTITEPRPESLAILRWRYPANDVRALDLDAPDPAFTGRFEVVFCYGTLYHLSQPEAALEWMAARCDRMLLLETCVLPGDDERIASFAEEPVAAENSVSGRGCRPTRRWLQTRLARAFPHVYLPTTQPSHEEFPVDWTAPPANPFLCRAVFVASRVPLERPGLTTELPRSQTRV
jgi:hypothetical protein